MSDLSREIRQFCSNHGLRLSTSLGQHFLIDESVLRTIVETADIRPADYILEIGAGIGILTRELLKRAGRVTAIELDTKLISLLKNFATKNEQTNKRENEFAIIQGDALKTPFPTEPYKIVANIPYHITSPLLRHAFIESQTHPTTMTLLIQREVAEKIVDLKNAGLLTILVGLFGKPSLIRVVPPESFLPPPKVESAVLHIECFRQPLAEGETLEEVFRLTRLAFSQKRKMLRNTIGALGRSHPGTSHPGTGALEICKTIRNTIGVLGQSHPGTSHPGTGALAICKTIRNTIGPPEAHPFPGAIEGMERLRSAGIDPTRRPQTLSVEEWIRLAKCA